MAGLVAAGTGTQTDEDSWLEYAISGNVHEIRESHRHGLLSTLLSIISGKSKPTNVEENVGAGDQRNISVQTEADPEVSKGVELSCLIIEDLALENPISSSYRDDIYSALRHSVSDLMRKHAIFFNGLITRIGVTNSYMFSSVANELFEINANNEPGPPRILWGRIISLFAFAVRLAQEHRHSPSKVTEITRFLASYVTRSVVPFVRDVGGWASLVEEFPPPTDEEAIVRKAFLVSGICVGLLATYCVSRSLFR